MEISVQARHEEMVQPEIARLHASARAEAFDKNEVLRRTTEAVNLLHEQFKVVQGAGGAVDIVVRPISVSSWRPMVKGRPQPALYRASAGLRADFTDFAALADLAAQVGGIEGVELGWVEWRITDATRLELENLCLTKAVEQARQRAATMAHAAGAGEVTFVQLADQGLLGEAPSARQAFEVAAPVPGAMMRSAKGPDEPPLAGIELRPEELSVAVVVEARLNA
ncbi:SIMPL domain-containing protein [Micropruina sp.]|uniref:SIMPL domain-containing protein n=1 Tax=Micropruina sp. TaxID=2737536 RepID=UPI0039E3652B